MKRTDLKDKIKKLNNIKNKAIRDIFSGKVNINTGNIKVVKSNKLNICDDTNSKSLIKEKSFKSVTPVAYCTPKHITIVMMIIKSSHKMERHSRVVSYP